MSTVTIDRTLVVLAVTALKQAALVGHAAAQAMKDQKARQAMMASVTGTADLVRLLEGAMEAPSANIATDLAGALRDARNQVVAFALDAIGADRAEKAVAHIDALLART